MSDPPPRPSRGRGRGRHGNRQKEDRMKDVRRQGTEGGEGRWQHDRWQDDGLMHEPHDKGDKYDGNPEKQRADKSGGGERWQHDKWLDDEPLDKKDTYDGNPEKQRADESGEGERWQHDKWQDDDRLYEPYGKEETYHNPVRRGEVNQSTRLHNTADSARKEPCESEKTRSAARPARNRPKRPEVQRYVPRARRLQEEAAQKLNTSTQGCESDHGTRQDGKNETEPGEQEGDRNSLTPYSGRKPSADLRETDKNRKSTDRKKRVKDNVYIPPGRRSDVSTHVENSKETVENMEVESHRTEIQDERLQNINRSSGVRAHEQEVKQSDKFLASIEGSNSVPEGLFVKQLESNSVTAKSSQEVNLSRVDGHEYEVELSQSMDTNFDEFRTDQNISRNHPGNENSECFTQIHDQDNRGLVTSNEDSVGDESVKVSGKERTKEVLNSSEDSDRTNSRTNSTEYVCSENTNKKLKIENFTLIVEKESISSDIINDLQQNNDNSAINTDNMVSSVISSSEKAGEVDSNTYTSESLNTLRTDNTHPENEEYTQSQEEGTESLQRQSMETSPSEVMTEGETTPELDTEKVEEKPPKEVSSCSSNESEIVGQDRSVSSQADKTDMEVDSRKPDIEEDKKDGNNEEDEDDEDSWDKMFDDDGDCLDPSAVEELTKKVGKVKIQKAKINYLDFKPKDPDIDYDEMAHVIEIFDFPAEFKTEDLFSIFQSYKDKGFDIKWVDDTHALGVFSSPIAAQSALSLIHPLCKVGPLTDATRASKVKAKRSVEFLQPYKPRPETSAAAARRLVSGALGITTRVSKEQREMERQKLREAKEKRKLLRKQKDDIWEGTCTGQSSQHDDR